MICAVAFGTSVLVGFKDDLAGIGIGAWAIGLLIFIINAARLAKDREKADISSAEVASLVFIAATFVPAGAWLDAVVRLAAIGSLSICELK